MAEIQLRQVWSDLMPHFPDPAALLNISDPDDRAATMLIKTLYVLFQGILQDRHQLRCEKQPSDSAASRAGGSVPPTVGSGHHTTPARPAGGAASAPPASAEEYGPSSPDDLVPPSPGDVTYFNQPKRSAPSRSSSRPVVLAPETADIPCAPRGGPPTRPVPETALPPPVVWVPETLESSPGRRGHRPCPVAETVQLPATPPRPVRPIDPVSPVLTGRTPATRRARRRAGATASPRQSQGPASAAARGTYVATPQNERRAEVASPTPSLSSPLLLPQHPPGRARRPPTTEATPAELPKRNGGKAASSAVPATSVRPTAGKGHGEGDQPAASASVGRAQSQGACQTQSRSPNKRKRLIIGPGEPVPPRKRKQSVSPQKTAPQERTATGCSSGSNSRTGVSEQPASRTPTKAPASAHTTATPTKRTAPSIFDLEIDPNKTGKPSASNKAKRTSPRRKPTPPGPSEEQRTGDAAAGSAQTDETPLGLDVLMEELNRDKHETNNRTEAHAQPDGHGRAQAKEGGADEARTEKEKAAVGRDGRADGDEVMAPPAEPPEHDSQEETQMDSVILGDEQPVAGPVRRYAASPVRRRADRQKLPGWSCAVCKEWYADRNMTDEELRAHMNRCSRHRQQEPPPPDTPPEFWDPVAFPATDITQYGAVTPRTRPRRRL